MNVRQGRPRDSRSQTKGSVSLEAVIIIPAFLLFLALIAGIARVAMVQADLHAAVVQATRTAATTPDPTTGDNAARQAVSSHLADESSPCTSPIITSDTAALALPPGESGRVSVSVVCAISLADLSVPGMPGEVTLTATFSTPIDAYAMH